MIINNVNLGIKKVFTNSYLTFDVVNNGTTDLFVYDVTTSSNNIFLNYINLPITIPSSNNQTINGYLKILNMNDSTNNDYIDLFTYYINDSHNKVYETYRYYLNYNGIMDMLYTNIWTVSNIRNINNMLFVFVDFYDLTSTEFPKLVLASIDNVDYQVLPKTYRISKNKVIYMFQDNNIIGRIVNNEIKFIMLSNSNKNNILSFAQRTI